jgi:hypothetical protein
MKLTNLTALTASSLFCAAALFAAEPSLEQRNGWSGDTRGAVPRMSKPPTIDGIIGADEWAGAAEFNAQVSQAPSIR